MPLSAPGVPAANTTRTLTPTAQQEDIRTAARSGGTVVVSALAGTGKTSTLKIIAGDMPHRPGTYLAFNKSVQLAAQGTFPGRVTVTTAHGLAYRAVGSAYGHRLPGNGAPRVSALRMASKLKVKPLDTGDNMINPVVLTRMAQATVANFMKTADREIETRHIPARVLGLHAADTLATVIIPTARRIWADLASTTGSFYFTHDVYLKLWQLRGGQIPGDYVMFDEAQDADPVIASMVARHPGQRIYVGDENQAIYGWRGAVDAMSKVENATRLPLTRSFRFGPAIAEQANGWLDLLGSDLRVEGHPPVKSSVGELTEPRAILCRTNGTALGWVLAMHERQIPVALAPGDRSAGKDMERFAWAARDLMKGEGTDHPDLVGFPDWNALVAFVEEEEDTADLKRMVGIINRIGPNGVIDAIRGLVPEDRARVTVSTAHKAKGLEWDSVKVADDFTPPDLDDETDEPDPSDWMLAYVTVTRAKLRLDPGSLAEPKLWSPR